MSQTFRFLLLLAIVGTGLPGCFLFGGDDDQPAPELIPPVAQLPPITSEGKGTFGCLVNGEPFVGYWSDSYATLSWSSNLYIYGDNKSPESVMDIAIYDYERQSGLIVLADSAATYTRYDNHFEPCDYDLKDFVEGWVDIIEYNSFEDYVSGTFEFTSVNDQCDTLRVTEGRFDLPVVR